MKKTKNELYKAPNILILILNRGRGNYFKCDLDFHKYFCSHPTFPIPHSTSTSSLYLCKLF